MSFFAFFKRNGTNPGLVTITVNVDLLLDIVIKLISPIAKKMVSGSRTIDLAWIRTRERYFTASFKQFGFPDNCVNCNTYVL